MQSFDRNFDWTIKKVYKVSISAEKQIDIPDQLHMAIYMPVWIAHWNRIYPAFQSLSISVQLEMDLFCLCFSLLFLPLNNNQTFLIWDELKLNLNLVSIATFKSIDSPDDMMSFKG